MTTLLDLLELPPHVPVDTRSLPLDERFELWRTRNPEVVEHITRLALGAAHRGARHLSMKSLFEAVRASGAFDGSAPEPWRLDNSFTAPMARYLMEHYPVLQGKFETRRRAA